MQGGQGDIKHWAFNDPPSGMEITKMSRRLLKTTEN